MVIFMAVLLLLGGCAVFLMGMKMMSEGLERSTGKGLRTMFGKISGNRFAGYGIGCAATALIQSSSATTVMTMGFVNAGIMTLFQATAIVLGAKLGTTVTGILVSLSAFSVGDFDINMVFVAMTIVGVFMLMFSKRDRLNKLGYVITGFGFIFMGMYVMKQSMSSETINSLFTQIFNYIDNPFLLLLIGVIFTSLIQSSSASSGLYIAMLGQGLITLNQSFFLMIGSNIGTCVTAIIAAVGATTNAKRVAFLHTLTSLIGAVIFGVILAIWQRPIEQLFMRAFDHAEWRLAIFNLVYNFSYTLLLLPFVKQLARLSEIIVPGKKDKTRSVLSFIDERILQTPAIAVAQVQKEVVGMALRARENFELSVAAILNRDIGQKEYIMEQEGVINALNKEIANYLIKISSLSIGASDEQIIGTLHHVINDIERIGDHAENFIETAQTMLENNIVFSEVAKDEIRQIMAKLSEMFDKSIFTIQTRSFKKLKEIGRLEEEVDTLHSVISNNHIERLNHAKCSVESGTYFYELVSELERVGDHLVNIAFSIKSPTGTQNA